MKRVKLRNRVFTINNPRPGEDYPVEVEVPDGAEICGVETIAGSQREAYIVVWWREEEVMRFDHPIETASYTGDMAKNEEAADRAGGKGRRTREKARGGQRKTPRNRGEA